MSEWKMIVNRFIFALVGFLLLRWKLIISSILVIFFIQQIHKYSQRASEVKTIVHSLRPSFTTTFSTNSTTDSIRSNFYHPQCMDSWLENDSDQKKKIHNYIRSKFNSFEGYTFLHDEQQQQPPQHEERYHCHPDPMNLPRLQALNREPFFGHFPHFAEMYFRFYSILIWQKRTYSLQNESCIHQLQVTSKNKKFWQGLQSESSSWNYNLIIMMNRISQYSTIVTDLGESIFDSERHHLINMKNREGYFLHPSDSLLLTSSLLNLNPCQLVGSSNQLLSKPIEVLIINRQYSRKILNIMNITSFFQELSQNQTLLHPHSLRRHHSGHIGNVKTTYFERKSFLEQAEETSHADIIFSIHGAQMTNLVFMKPCSVAIEVMPWLYNVPSYFGRFAESAGILHYSWEENSNNSIAPQSTAGEPFQKHSCVFYRTKYKRMYASGGYSPTDLANLCYHDGNGECRSCARAVDGINVSIDTLQHYLTAGIKAREKCIADHPFYNSAIR